MCRASRPGRDHQPAGNRSAILLVVCHTIRITATENYVVVLSTGEIAPDFGNKAALVAYERDGKPLDNFRLVMPGDKHGARDVHNIVTISVE